MRFLRHVWQSRPSLGEAFGVTLVWGITIPLCIFADYFLWRHMLPPNALRLTLIFASGAAVAAPSALWLANLFGAKNKYTAFAAAYVFLGIGTVGLTAAIFALDFWHYFVQWHGETFSKLWLVQFVFTFASAIYQFLVSGLRLYLPFGPIALALASIWASRRITR